MQKLASTTFTVKLARPHQPLPTSDLRTGGLGALTLAFSISLFLPVQLAQGHHSTLGVYALDRIIEIEGVVTSVRWRNPHAAYLVTVTDADGDTVEWAVETGSLSTLRLRGVGRSAVNVGDQITFSGEASLRGRPEMFARNLLLENGQEVLLTARSEPRWPAGLAGNLLRPTINDATAADARRTADGIFRVWTTVLNDPASFPLYREGVSPLTESARRLKAQWDPRASPYLGCQPRGMPYLMTTPYPFEFVRQGNDLLLRAELDDTERLIRMSAAPASPSSGAYSPLGYSTGRWEGNRLIVETDRIDAPYFYGDGTPQSNAIRLVEHFTLNETTDRLDYRLFVTDPATFTEPLEFTRYWAWRPDVRVELYNCEE